MREYKGDVIIEVMSGTLSAVKVMPDMLNYPSYTRIDSLFLPDHLEVPLGRSSCNAVLSLWTPVRPGLVDIGGLLGNEGVPTASVTTTLLQALNNQVEAFD